MARLLNAAQALLAHLVFSNEKASACVTSKGSSVVILLLYSPGSTAANQDFFTELSSMMESLVVLTDPVVMTGESNIRLNRMSGPLCTQFNNIIESFGVASHVDQPMHDHFLKLVSFYWS